MQNYEQNQELQTNVQYCIRVSKQTDGAETEKDWEEQTFWGVNQSNVLKSFLIQNFMNVQAFDTLQKPKTIILKKKQGHSIIFHAILR